MNAEEKIDAQMRRDRSRQTGTDEKRELGQNKKHVRFLARAEREVGGTNGARDRLEK